MEENNKLALIVAYYLSKFDVQGVKQLGYGTFRQAVEDIGEKLGVKPNTVKNMRDEFDPFHENGRAGWYQRELRPSRAEVIEKYGELSELALREVVNDIMNQASGNGSVSEEVTLYISSIDEKETQESKLSYTTRGITGKKAEDIFKEAYYKGVIEGYQGEIVDRTNDGCGYDFEIQSDKKIVFEVKGSIGTCNGIMFTDKEWETANELKDRYILVIVSEVDSVEPKISTYLNPVSIFKATKNVRTVIAVSWNVDSKQIKSYKQED